MTTLDERETHIGFNAASDKVSFYSDVPKHIRALKKDPRVTLTKEGTFADGTRFAYFECDAKGWSPLSGPKRTRKLTPEQRKAAAERMRKAREAKREVTAE